MILIIGAGIAGLSTAIALQQQKIDYRILEAVPEIKTVGAGISLAGNAMLVLKKLGVSEDVKKYGQLISSMIIQDDKGKCISVMNADKLSVEYGMENVAIHRGELHHVLLSKIDSSKILTNKKAVTFEENHDGVSVSFEDGSTLTGNGVIVADGIHSIFRKKLLPSSLPRYSGYTCWRGVVENKWNLSRVAVEMWGRSGRFGYVPIGNNKVYWFACKNAAEKDEGMKGWTAADLTQNFQSFAHPVAAIMQNTPANALIWSNISDLKPLDRFAFGKVVLIGDAGHATTPNLGQGACLGIEDAFVIAEELSKTENIEAAFQAFEQKRLKRVHFIVNTSHRLGTIAQLENKMLIGLRNTLLRLTPDSVNDRLLAQVLNVSNALAS